MFRIAIATVIVAAAASPSFADQVTLPSWKFVACLAATTKTMDCVRENKDSDWSCRRHRFYQATLPQCTRWDMRLLAHGCRTWTDGTYLYGGISSPNPSRKPGATEPMYNCVENVPREEAEKYFDVEPRDPAAF